MTTHRCNTESPSRHCCWAARNAELDALRAAQEARIAKYGQSNCPRCNKVYRVIDGIVEDHDAVCTGPLTDAQIWR